MAVDGSKSRIHNNHFTNVGSGDGPAWQARKIEIRRKSQVPQYGIGNTRGAMGPAMMQSPKAKGVGI